MWISLVSIGVGVTTVAGIVWVNVFDHWRRSMMSAEALRLEDEEGHREMQIW